MINWTPSYNKVRMINKVVGIKIKCVLNFHCRRVFFFLNAGCGKKMLVVGFQFTGL